MEAAGLLMGVLLGYLVVRWSGVVRGLRPGWATVVLEVSLGVGVGAALTAVLFFFLLAAGAAQRWVLLAIELLTLAGLAALAFRGRKTEPPNQGEPDPGWRWNSVLAAGVALALLLITLAQIDTARVSPYGEFDAFAMWNVRAKFLLGPGDTWHAAYSPMLIRQRPDHPLLLSAFVAQAWRIGGDRASPVAPFGAAMLFYASIAGMLASIVALVRGASSALLALLILVANTSFLQQTTWQYADIPAGMFFLGCFALLVLSQERAGRARTAALAMSGAFASFAAMTKNEGIPFLLLTLACYTVVQWRTAGLSATWRSVCPWILGALPGFSLQMGFKIFLAPSGEGFAGPTISQIVGLLGESGRYAVVAGHFLGRLVDLGSGLSHPLILLAILAAVLRFEIDDKARPLLIVFGSVLALQLLTYSGVYLTTMDDLEWRLGTSLGRLYSQLWPSIVLLAFLALGVPRDPVTELDGASGKDAKKPAGGKAKKKAKRSR